MATEFHELRAVGLDLRQDVLLVVVTDRHARLAEGIDALEQRAVIQLAVQADPRGQPLGLLGVGV